jgi:hypothetical protein
MKTSTISLLAGLCALACVREAVPPLPAPASGPTPPGYAWPPRVIGAAENPAAAALLVRAPAEPGAAEPAETAAPEPIAAGPVPALSSGAIPGGDACVAKLDQLGVVYSRLDARRGVETPIVVKGSLGGIEYVAGAGLPFECDCRLAVALFEVGPVLAGLGIEKLRYSGVYTYRTSRVGRLSLHAYGLAIDVHFAFADGRWYDVKSDYKAGLADGCGSEAPLLNRTACTLKRTGLFKELLTPDHNADHRDHFHLGIAPLGPPPSAPETGGKSITAQR